MDELYNSIVKEYSDGFLSYCVTLTFKPDIDYSILHPKEAHQRFSNVFSKYGRSKKLNYYLVPEISKSGNLHYHGLIIIKGTPTWEKDLKLIRNYCNRKFGRNTFQRIYSYYTEYSAENLRNWFTKKTLTTSFRQIWNYIHKEQTPKQKYHFLPIITNLS